MAGIPALAATRVKLPKALSPGEEMFAFHMNVRGLQPVREHPFCPGRRWRFDFAFLDRPTVHGNLLAIEIDGGAFSKGRHTRGNGFSNDLEKLNTAILMGWSVLRYSTAMVKSGVADLQVATLLGIA